MTIDDVQQIFHRFDKHIKTLRDISMDTANKVPLCDCLDTAYCYDDIVNAEFQGGDIFDSVDAITIKKDCINFIEFKNTDMSHLKSTDMRLKIAEGFHYIEKVVLKANFFAAHGIKTRFILVYSKEKNVRESKKQKEMNDALMAFSTLQIHNRFIGKGRYDKKWEYVDEAISMDEIEFKNNREKYV